MYSSESVTIYTGGVLRDKPTNPTISLGISYTRLEIIGESVGNKYKDITFLLGNVVISKISNAHERSW